MVKNFRIITNQEDHYVRCMMCGFMVDDRSLTELIEHLHPHFGVPWQAWLRSPLRAWRAAIKDSKATR